MRTFSMTVYGAGRAKAVATAIINSSQWFAFTPLPCDEYEFAVKEENGGLLQQAVTAAYDSEPLRPDEGDHGDEDEDEQPARCRFCRGDERAYACECI